LIFSVRSNPHSEQQIVVAICGSCEDAPTCAPLYRVLTDVVLDPPVLFRMLIREGTEKNSLGHSHGSE